MYELYVANKNYSSWSLRPWILLRELGIPFEERLVPFTVSTNWDTYRKFSPSGRVPCLVDDGFAVWDSLAIVEYVAERHPAVWPKDAKTRAWARCVAAEMHSGFGALRGTCSMNCGLRVALHRIDAALAKDVARIDEIWSEGLATFGGPFLAGASFTAVDAFFAPVVFRVNTYGLPVGDAAKGYVERMLARPGMRAWYDAALRETWREPDHEAEALANGTVTADFRTG
ncbi:MAG: glutathione S-transferase family protein [Polyangiaceae bacterium]